MATGAHSLSNGDRLVVREGWVARIDPQGDIIWQKRMELLESDLWAIGQPGVGELSDQSLFFTSIVDTAAVPYYYPHWLEQAVVRLSPTGDLLWGRRIAKTSSATSALAKLGEVGLQLFSADSARSAIQVISLDSLGAVQWTRKFGPVDAPSYHLDLRKAVRASDGGAFVLASHFDFGVFIIRLDALGHLLWARSYDHDEFSLSEEMTPTANGELLIVGANNRVARLSSAGTFLWIMRLFPTVLYTAQELSDGNILVLGAHTPFQGPYNSLRVLLGADGSHISTTGSDELGFGQVLAGHAGEVDLAGGEPLYLCRLPIEGSVNCTSLEELTLSVDTLAGAGYSGTAIPIVETMSSIYEEDLLVTEGTCEWIISDPCSFPWAVGEHHRDQEALTIFPTPAQQGTDLSIVWAGELLGSRITVTDPSGRLLASSIAKRTDEYTIDTSGFEPGIYIISATSRTGAVRSGRTIVH